MKLIQIFSVKGGLKFYLDERCHVLEPHTHQRKECDSNLPI